MKLNPEQKAVMYAAFKELERILKQSDNDSLPIGEYDVSGKTVTVTLPDMTVTRDGGEKGDGIINKTATQNLYGWGVIAALADRLKRFNQWETTRHLLLDAVRACLTTTGSTVETELANVDEAFAAQVAEVREELRPPARPENTPRMLNRVRPRQLARVTIED